MSVSERTHTLVLQVDPSLDLLEIAKETDGFSGSDLREMCRDAALLCVRDFVHTQDDRYESATNTWEQIPAAVVIELDRTNINNNMMMTRK